MSKTFLTQVTVVLTFLLLTSCGLPKEILLQVDKNERKREGKYIKRF